MSPLEKILHDYHPEARIVSVETDEHEHRDTVCCDITGKRLIEDEELLDGTGAIWAKVARIMIKAPGEEPEALLSRTDSEWLPICQAQLDEAKFLATGTVDHGLLVDEAVAQNHAKSLKQEGFVGVQIILRDNGFRIQSQGKGEAA